MFRWFLSRKVNAEEHRLGASMDYLRHILQVSPTAFLRFASLMPLANSRRTLPKEAWYVAQLVTLQAEDCGTCLQIGVNLAKKDGVALEVIRSVLNRDSHALSADLQDVYEFALVATQPDADITVTREKLRDRYGERGLIELSYVIASSRVPPTVKRVLGFAESCSVVEVHT